MRSREDLSELRQTGSGARCTVRSVLGRRARTLSGSVCVTVGMGISRLAPVRLGDALEVESHTEGQHGETLVVSGRFRVNSLPVFSATSLWKMVEKK